MKPAGISPTRILLLGLSALLAALSQPAAASPSALQLAQQIDPPKQAAPAKPAPAGKTGAGKSTLSGVEAENKKLRDEVRDLTDRLEKAEKENVFSASRLKHLEDQVRAMTKPGGRLVRSYCDGDSMSRNTAGAENNCASRGYACEPVSGLCYARCSNNYQCALGWVCDAGAANCVRSN
jgi:hypothetical protein